MVIKFGTHIVIIRIIVIVRHPGFWLILGPTGQWWRSHTLEVSQCQ